jgi:hypothetical protein
MISRIQSRLLISERTAENGSSGVGSGAKLLHSGAMADSANSLELLPARAMTLSLE